MFVCTLSYIVSDTHVWNIHQVCSKVKQLENQINLYALRRYQTKGSKQGHQLKLPMTEGEEAYH
jgi:hypothetical protein